MFGSLQLRIKFSQQLSCNRTRYNVSFLSQFVFAVNPFQSNIDVGHMNSVTVST